MKHHTTKQFVVVCLIAIVFALVSFQPAFAAEKVTDTFTVGSNFTLPNSSVIPLSGTVVIVHQYNNDGELVSIRVRYELSNSAGDTANPSWFLKLTPNGFIFHDKFFVKMFDGTVHELTNVKAHYNSNGKKITGFSLSQ